MVDKLSSIMKNVGLPISHAVRGMNEQPSGDILWHYTTGEKLIAIIESRTLWSTQISCLNDSQELNFSVSTLEKALSKQKNLSQYKHLNDLYTHFSNLLRPVENTNSKIFVLSFSEVGNDLSQWRAYGGLNGENGYCIGFDRKKLSEFGQVRKVVYFGVPANASSEDILAQDNVQNFFESSIPYYADIYFKGAKSYIESPTDNPSGDQDIDSLLQSFAGFLFRGNLDFLFPFIKHGSFLSERECRVTHILADQETSKLRFLQRSHMMTRHLPLGLQRSSSRLALSPCDSDVSKLLPLPIREIMVGPARHQKISRESVEAMLVKNNHKKYDKSETSYDWGAVSVTCSETPIQNV